MALGHRKQRIGQALPTKLEAVLVRLCHNAEPRTLTITQAVKLPYLVDVMAARVLGTPITEGTHQAWDHGVVTSELWHHLDGLGARNTVEASTFTTRNVPFSESKLIEATEQASDAALSEEELRIVDFVSTEYGSLSATELGLMTKYMNPAMVSWGSNRAAKVNEDAYIRMTPDYQEMAQTINDTSFEAMAKSAQPMERSRDVLA